MNAVIRGVAKTAIHRHGMEVVGFLDGFEGLIEKRFLFLDHARVSGILTMGGTILGTSNRANPFKRLVIDEGAVKEADASDDCLQLYGDLRLEALICVGGDGTMAIADRLSRKGARIVGVPKTIDKDVMETETTFGFDSARAVATDAIDKLHTTAQSHHRVMVVEVMGRNAGWLALESGIAGGGDVVVIPEIPFDIEAIIGAVRKRSLYGKRFSIVVVAEGAKSVGGEQVFQHSPGGGVQQPRLGGVGRLIAEQIEKHPEMECRVTILGHLQRGGPPTPCDRLLATQFAVKAVELAANQQFNHMVAQKGGRLVPVPLERVAGKQRRVPLDSPLIEAALALGMHLGAD